MILESAEGFLSDRWRVFCAHIENATYGHIWLSVKSVQKNSILPKQVEQADQSGWVRFVLPCISAQRANQYFLMNLRVWEKLRKLFFRYFHRFSPIFTCDRPMVPITTLESFKSGACVVPGSTWGDLQTHTKTTMRCGFVCLVEMCENCDWRNTDKYDNQG